MRPSQAFTYRLNSLPPVPEVLQFLVNQTNMTPQDAYGTFNMGAGFAVYCAEGAGQQVVDIAKSVGQEAWVCGVVEDGDRKVVLDTIGVTYTDEDLQLR